ncbi:hypothetical protein C7H85_18125 [Zobellella endophytica]|uniref:NnrS family protein n=1 Tax=Zobellella endophytica TaxID=2116700 RepID=A0A2P7QTW6_9GAMM|nr:hypothetical protein [Zobellella endophytica]PSJ41395.1 hypothetical protein C7H85_18125 [Zobellella endophytica]
MILLLIPMMVLLVLAIGGGAWRLGVDWLPLTQTGLIYHGALMVNGFFATLISCERCVAYGDRRAWLVPLCGILASVSLWWAPALAPPLYGLLAAGMTGLSWLLWRRQPQDFTLLLVLACGSLLLANLYWWWLGGIAPVVLRAWLVFLVLTIAAERLELSRLLPRPLWARRAFMGLSGLLLLAPWLPSGRLWLGLALILLALWLWRFDIARKTIRTSGLPRYVAACLLSGYGWLALSGGLWLSGAMADMALHGVMLGFVMAMVFGHAPVIVPALLNIRCYYHALLYLPLLVLQLGLVARPWWPQVSAHLTSLAVVGFVLGFMAIQLRGQWRLQ